MRIMRCLTLFLAALVLNVDGAKLRKHHTKHPTKVPTVSSSPTPPTSPTSKPTWAFSPEQYYYYAKLYYERAKFDYDNFPHEGPSFYAAQADEARAKFYQAQGKAETASETIHTQSPTALTPEEYLYEAGIYYSKAAFDYDLYKKYHDKVDLKFAQEDEAYAKKLEALGKGG